MMASVVSSIQQLGMKVEHTPGGCTSLCHPVDVRINRSQKANIHEDWENLMLDLGMIASLTEPPTRKLIVEWVMKA